MNFDNLKDQLIHLGAEKLADALVDLSNRSDQALELIERLLSTPEENLQQFKSKLSDLKRNGRFVESWKTRDFAQELEDFLSDIRAVVEAPKTGLELVTAFFKSDSKILEACDDSDGLVSNVFHFDAIELFIYYAKNIKDESLLSNLVFELYQKDDYGVRDALVNQASKFLSEETLRSLAQRFWENAKTPENDEYKVRHFLFAVESLARQLKDAPLFEKAALAAWPKLTSNTCLDIAEVYFEAGNPEKALQWVMKIPPEEIFFDYKRDALLLNIYKKTNDQEKLKEVAWQIFRKQRHVETLKQLLSIIGEDQRERVITEAVQGILSNPHFSESDLSFLLQINQIDQAQCYLFKNVQELDGYRDNFLLPIAQQFEKENRFLAATMIYRELLESILNRAISKYYHHGVRYLKKLEELAPDIADWEEFLTHDQYRKKINETHFRKKSFWMKYKRANKVGF